MDVDVECCQQPVSACYVARSHAVRHHTAVFSYPFVMLDLTATDAMFCFFLVCLVSLRTSKGDQLRQHGRRGCRRRGHWVGFRCIEHHIISYHIVTLPEVAAILYSQRSLMAGNGFAKRFPFLLLGQRGTVSCGCTFCSLWYCSRCHHVRGDEGCEKRIISTPIHFFLKSGIRPTSTRTPSRTSRGVIDNHRTCSAPILTDRLLIGLRHALLYTHLRYAPPHQSGIVKSCERTIQRLSYLQRRNRFSQLAVVGPLRLRLTAPPAFLATNVQKASRRHKQPSRMCGRQHVNSPSLQSSMTRLSRRRNKLHLHIAQVPI